MQLLGKCHEEDCQNCLEICALPHAEVADRALDASAPSYVLHATQILQSCMLLKCPAVQADYRSLKAFNHQFKANARRGKENADPSATPAPKRARNMHTTAEKGTRNYTRAVNCGADRFLSLLQKMAPSSDLHRTSLLADTLLAAIDQLPDGNDILQKIAIKSGIFDAVQQAVHRIEEH